MKVVTATQGDAAWRAARIGIPTASCFDRILTAKTRKLAAGRATYMHELLASWLLGTDVTDHDGEGGGFMLRGTALEQQARDWYSFTRGVEVERVGFCLDDGGLYGASPDGLVGDDGLVEFKIPSAKVFMGLLLDDDPVADYYAQVQGEMLVAEREWNDLVFWHPTLPPRVVRVHADIDYQFALAGALGTFCGELHAARAKLLARGMLPKPALPIAARVGVPDLQPF